MNMRTVPFVLVMVVALALSAPAHVAGQDSVSLCFDLPDTTNCRPDITTYPHVFQALLVLRNCSSAGGLDGWEGTIDFPAEITLGAVDLGTGVTNTGSGTAFHVIYDPPRSHSSRMILATLTLVATGPGSIYLHGYQPSLLPETLAPVYMAAGDPSHLVVMNYDLGSPFHPVMTVATVDCPAIASSDGLSLSPPDTASAAIPDLPITETSSHPNAPATAKELDQVNWSFLLAHSSIAARGTLLEKESSFVLLEGRPTGLAHLRLAIQEAISGPVPETLDVWATGVTFPGKLTYVGWSGFPMYDELSIGQDILVFATLTGSTAWTNNHRVFILQDQSPQTTSALSSIRSLAGHMTPRDQMGNADLVVLAKPRSDPAVLAVVATYRGTAPGESIRVNHSTAERIAYAQSRYNSTMQGVLCFLFLSQDGEYALVCGNRSLFVVATDAIHDLNSARLVPATLCYPK